MISFLGRRARGGRTCVTLISLSARRGKEIPRWPEAIPCMGLILLHQMWVVDLGKVGWKKWSSLLKKWKMGDLPALAAAVWVNNFSIFWEFSFIGAIDSGVFLMKWENWQVNRANNGSGEIPPLEAGAWSFLGPFALLCRFLLVLGIISDD